MTDGAPADIDERDPQNRHHDTRTTVEEPGGQGMPTCCLILARIDAAYVRRIFGEEQHNIVDHVRRLPEKLPTLFASFAA